MRLALCVWIIAVSVVSLLQTIAQNEIKSRDAMFAKMDQEWTEKHARALLPDIASAATPMLHNYTLQNAERDSVPQLMLFIER